jgi:hypothetical protein
MHPVVGLFKLFLNPVKSALGFSGKVGNELLQGDLTALKSCQF